MERRLIVLQHGSHGHAKDFDLIRRAVDTRSKALGIDVRFVVPDVVAGRGTDKGLRHCVHTLSPGIVEEVARFKTALERDGAKGSVSMLGHSFGGLMLRGVVGNLHSLGYIQADHRRRKEGSVLEWGTFVSVGSPHLGVGLTSTTLKVLARTASVLIDSQAYRDLLLQSSSLSNLASDPSVCAGLQAFQKRVAIAAAGDHLVSPASALIAPVTKRDVRAVSRIGSMPATPNDAWASVVSPKISRPVDSYGLPGPIDLAPWVLAAPRFRTHHREQAAFMASQIRETGAWDSWVAKFPLWAAPTAHRAVIGKAPYNTPGKVSQAHVDGVAALLLGQDPTTPPSPP